MARPTGYSFLRAFTLLAPVLLLIVRWSVQRQDAPSSCPRDPIDGTVQPVRTIATGDRGSATVDQDSGDCFFSDSYFEARKQFRFLAQVCTLP
jgi:hypothetical protein